MWTTFECQVDLFRSLETRFKTQKENERQEKLKVNIGEEKVDEAAKLKTLGVIFDPFLKWKEYWEEVRGKVQRKLFAISQIKSNLTFIQRKDLGRGLIGSRLEYCLEATSTCSRSQLEVPKKLLNRTTRTVTNNWDFMETKKNYVNLGWLTIEEQAIFKSYTAMEFTQN